MLTYKILLTKVPTMYSWNIILYLLFFGKVKYLNYYVLVRVERIWLNSIKFDNYGGLFHRNLRILWDKNLYYFVCFLVIKIFKYLKDVFMADISRILNLILKYEFRNSHIKIFFLLIFSCIYLTFFIFIF